MGHQPSSRRDKVHNITEIALREKNIKHKDQCQQKHHHDAFIKSAYLCGQPASTGTGSSTIPYWR